MPLVEFTTHDDVALIQLNRPPVNALSTELVSDIDEAVGRAEDAAFRAVVTDEQAEDIVAAGPALSVRCHPEFRHSPVAACG